MRIRDATLADLDFIAGGNLAMAQETEDVVLDPALLHPGIRAVFEDPSVGRYYLAEAAGKPVGQLMTTYEWSDWRNGVFLWVQSIYVIPAHRGTGALKSFYKVMESVFRGPASRG